MRTEIATKLAIEWDDDLPPLDDLPEAVRGEVMDRLGLAMGSAAWLNRPLSPQDYVPQNVTISISRQAAYSPDGTYEAGEAGYMPVKEHGYWDPNEKTTDMWGIFVLYFDPEDGSSGSVIYRTQLGTLAHWM